MNQTSNILKVFLYLLLLNLSLYISIGNSCDSGNEMELDLSSATVNDVSGNPSMSQYQKWELDLSDQNLSLSAIAVDVSSNMSCAWCKDNNIYVYYDDGSSDKPGSSATMVTLPMGKGKKVVRITGGHGITGVVQHIDKVTVCLNEQPVYTLKDSNPSLGMPVLNENTISGDLLAVTQYNHTEYSINTALESVAITANTVGLAGFTSYNQKSSLNLIFYFDGGQREDVYQEFSGLSETISVAVPTVLTGKMIERVGFTHGASGTTISVRRIDMIEAEAGGNNTCGDFNDGYQAGIDFCKNNPSACGISTGGITPCPPSGSTILNNDLSFSIPSAVYQSPSINMELEIDFKFFGEQSGKLLWELESYKIK